MAPAILAWQQADEVRQAVECFFAFNLTRGRLQRGMPTLDEIVAYCDRRTRRAAFLDFPGACNGLQVANNGRVTRIGAAVDAGLAPFEQAVAAGVDFLIVHHGLFWSPPRPITGPTYRKLSDAPAGQLRAVFEPSAARRPPRDRQQRAARAPARPEARPLVSGARGRGHRLHRTEPDAARRAAAQARGTLSAGRGDRVRLRRGPARSPSAAAAATAPCASWRRPGSTPW